MGGINIYLRTLHWTKLNICYTRRYNESWTYRDRHLPQDSSWWFKQKISSIYGEASKYIYQNANIQTENEWGNTTLK